MGTLNAQTFPIEWTLDAFETPTSEWWQALDVKTVPGVKYRLQESSTLNPDEWTTFSSSYGTGGNWICPVFPGSAPSILPPSGNPVLPPATSTPVRTAYLTIERTDAGDTLVSWNSLDDNTPLRKLLSNVTLDPVWDDFESFYLNHHGSHFFALSPRLGTPVAFSENTITLGPFDTAMLADFIAEFPAITSNIQNSVAAAASFSPQPLQTGDRAFFRIAADWSVDSDSDGRFEKKTVVFTDRSLNGSSLAPAFELKTFTLPANQTVSNPVDLESGFTSDGPAGGPSPPPAATPAGHVESFTKQLVPIQVDDNEFSTGVDNVSITPRYRTSAIRTSFGSWPLQATILRESPVQTP